ncbi:MAG: hypothetical protein EZS28_038294, partial [Streblomastix strix]
MQRNSGGTGDSQNAGAVTGVPAGFADVDVLDDQIPENDQSCTVCGLNDSYEDNPIIYCDGCQVAVHAACYMVQQNELAKDEWLCRACKKNVKPRMDNGANNERRKCQLCHHFGGA